MGRMEFRIGVSLGEVIIEGDRIYGDGVNIAARVRGLAEDGGVCISGSVYDEISSKLSSSPTSRRSVGSPWSREIRRSRSRTGQ